MSDNGMDRPCSCPAGDKLSRGAKTRESTAISKTLNSAAIAVIGIDIGKNSFMLTSATIGTVRLCYVEVVAWPG